MKQQKYSLYQLFVIGFFLCIILTFSVIFTTDSIIDSPGATADRCYDGTVIKGDSFFDRFGRAVYQNKPVLDRITEYEYRLFDTVSDNNVIAGKNDFLFRVEDKENGYNYIRDYLGQLSFTEEEHQKILETLRAKEKRYADVGVKYLLVILPNRQTVYPELMPSYLGPISENTRLRGLEAFLKKNRFSNYIDMTDTLTMNKGDGALYDNTGTSLNALGLYYVYRSVSFCFSPNMYDAKDVITRAQLDFYQHLTKGKSVAIEAGLEDVVLNRTISLSNDTLLDYRVLFNSGYAAKTVRLPDDYGGVTPDSPALLLQFSNYGDRLQAEPFFSNTFTFVTYQQDLSDNAFVFHRANPSVVVQFLYENELSQLISP